MNQYIPKSLDIKLTVKKQIKKAKILDIVSSTPELLPSICGTETFIQQSSCSHTMVEMDKNK